MAADLAACFRLRTAIATAMVDYPVGELVDERIRAMGVRPIYRRFAHDGVRGPNIATVYSDRGFGVRAPVVFYNRADEAAARLGPGDVDWPALFGAGVRWFHSGGIFAALSDSSAALIAEGMAAAHAAGALVSLDLNYRGKIWAPRGRPGPRTGGHGRGSPRRSTCSSATRRTSRRPSACPARAWPRPRGSTRPPSSA